MHRLVGLAAILAIVASACASSVDPAGGADVGGDVVTTTTPPSNVADTELPSVEDPALSETLPTVAPQDESDAPMTDTPSTEPSQTSSQDSKTASTDSGAVDQTTPPSEQADASRYDGPLPDLVAVAVADLVGRLGVSPSQVTVVSAESVVWPDGGLGCPQPDMNYTQVLVDGAKIVLSVDGKVFTYHSGGSRAPFLCVQGKPTTGQTPTTLVGDPSDE